MWLLKIENILICSFFELFPLEAIRFKIFIISSALDCEYLKLNESKGSLIEPETSNNIPISFLYIFNLKRIIYEFLNIHLKIVKKLAKNLVKLNYF